MRIGLLLIDGFALMSYSSVIEPLRAANLLSNKNLYKIYHLSPLGKEAISSSGAYIKTEPIALNKNTFDLVIVIAGGDPFKFEEVKTLDWLRRISRTGSFLGGVSGGPVILAKSGLMKKKRMTLHWEHIETFVETWPDIIIEKSLYVIDRDRLTCAGGIAPLDLMYAIITEQHGEKFARKVSDWFMHTEVRPSGGPQRAGIVERYGISNLIVVLAIEVMENHLSDTLHLNELSSRIGIGSRQLNRLFRKYLNQSTMTFYKELRLNLAKKLLKQSSLSITEIALSTGFTSSAHFSQAFNFKFSITPTNFRNSKK
tara:strand:+ start:128 stop:1066 length:939 start_codon:yes stop_codon:yes gene_type:complete